MTNKEISDKVLALLYYDSDETVREIYKLADEIRQDEKESQSTVDIADDDFGAIVNCAIRYSMGRRSYMPSLVIAFVAPLVQELTDKTLWCIDEDLSHPEIYGGLGDERIDAPSWIKFHDLVKAEIQRRKDKNEWKLGR